MNRAPVRVGFIGAGFAADLHVHGLHGVHGAPVEFAAVAASQPDSARCFAARHGVARVYETYQELLVDPEIDVVCICVPNSMHAPIVIAAAEAGKHIICEKPLTGAFGDSRGLSGVERALEERERARASAAEIADAVRVAGVLFLYAENWVYAPSVAKTKRLLAAAGGTIIDIRAEESHSGSHARRSRRRETAGGGSLLMLGSHAIGAALHLKDFEGRLRGETIRPIAVTAETARLYEIAAVREAQGGFLVDDWSDVETWANVVISFSDGAKAAITASFAMLGGVRNILEVYTTNGAYRANMTPNNSLEAFTPDPEAFGAEYLHEKIETRTGWMSVSPDEDWSRGYPQEMQNFVEAVRGEAEPISDLRLATDVVDVIYASYLSAESGIRVELLP